MRIKSIDDTSIRFDNGSILRYLHAQECCEYVYADFLNMQMIASPHPLTDTNQANLKDYEFFEDILDSIVCVEDMGFYIVCKNGATILVSCYNEQNGYYSNELILEHHYNGVKLQLPIHDVVFKHWEW